MKVLNEVPAYGDDNGIDGAYRHGGSLLQYVANRTKSWLDCDHSLCVLDNLLGKSLSAADQVAVATV